MLKHIHAIFYIIAVLLCVAFSSPARAEFELDAGLGYMWGNNTMESGNIPWGHGTAYYYAGDDKTLVFPRTRIEFPLDVYVGSINAEYRSGNWVAKASLTMNINDPRSRAKDEEMAVAYWDSSEEHWYYKTYSGPGMESFSTDVVQDVDVKLDAVLFNAKCLYRLFSYQAASPSSFDCFFGIGYEQRDFDYSGDVREITKADYIEEWTYAQSGPAGIDYTLKYTIPYLELAASGESEDIFVEARFGYSPFVTAEDSQDNYLGRFAGPYSADGDSDGYAYLAGLKMGYNLTPHWSINALFDYLKIRTDGEQTTTCAAGVAAAGTDHELTWPDDVWENDEEITSEQYILTLGVGYRF